MTVMDTDSVKHKTFTCMVCEFSTVNKLLIKEHIQTHYQEKSDEASKPHKCSFCDFRSHSEWNLRTHLKTHTDVATLKCPHCEFRTRLASTLKQHSLMHSGEAPYKCDLCDYGVYRMKNLEAHVNKVHHYAKPYKCDTCVYRATTKDILLKHIKRCSGIKITASLIKSAPMERNFEVINNPIRVLHENFMTVDANVALERSSEEMEVNDASMVIVNIPPLVCSLCEFTFNEEHELNEHMSCHQNDNNTKHGTDQSKISCLVEEGNVNVACLKLCEICGFQTYEIMDLQRHMFTNHINHVQCNHCSFTCGSVKELGNHIVDIHQVKYFFCKYCCYFCCDKHELNEHMLAHDKNYQCPKCYFHSKYKRLVLEHQFSHEKLRPYRCGCCGFQSGRASNLIRHQYVHTTIKPLKCKDCSYSTTQKRCLNRHIQKHAENI